MKDQEEEEGKEGKKQKQTKTEEERYKRIIKNNKIIPITLTHKLFLKPKQSKTKDNLTPS